LRRIGGGRSTDVFLGLEMSPGGAKQVVLKRLRADLLEDANIRETFAMQSEMMVRLRHPSLVQTLEAIDEGNERVVVAEFVDGQALSCIRQRPQAVTV